MENSLSFRLEDVVPGMALVRAADGVYEHMTFVVLGITPAAPHPGDRTTICPTIVYLLVRPDGGAGGDAKIKIDMTRPGPGSGIVFSRIAYVLYPNDERGRDER